MKESDNPSNEAIAELIVDPVIVKVITTLDIASLSILELLNSGLSRKEINWAPAKGIEQLDKFTAPAIPQESNRDIFALGDYYFGFLNSKVKLTEIGLYTLETIKPEQIDETKGDIRSTSETYATNLPNLRSGPTKFTEKRETNAEKRD